MLNTKVIQLIKALFVTDNEFESLLGKKESEKSIYHIKYISK